MSFHQKQIGYHSFYISLSKTQKQKSLSITRQAFQKKGGDILSHITAVPSAQSGLTSLFGMGRGEPRRNNHLKFLVISS